MRTNGQMDVTLEQENGIVNQIIEPCWENSVTNPEMWYAELLFGDDDNQDMSKLLWDSKFMTVFT
jgi:hypothetical protein